MSEDRADADSLAPDEALKARSRYLRGTITDGLADEATGAVDESDAKLLKFHGTYQQDDRDLRVERLHQKLEPAYEFMVRLRMPGGVCTPAQWLAIDRLADERANGTLRITTRQTFQLHGVLKRDLKATIAGINETLLTTVAACGDVARNVVCHNHPALSPVHAEVYADACRLSEAFAPRTRAYHEIWLDGERVAGAPAAGAEEEPLYGATYLPRKFKIGLAVPPSNDVDVFSQDLGLIAIVEDGELTGYDVAVGGGMGMSHGEPRTYPRLADVIGFCPREKLIDVAEAVVTLQRDHGNRSDRKRARLKYTIDDHGLEWFREALAERSRVALEPARAHAFEETGDALGWRRDAEGLWHLTLHVLSGRIRDDAERRLKSALREIARLEAGELRLTTNQNVTVAGVDDDARGQVEAILRAHGVDADAPVSALERASMSCVAFPTCALAMAESERALPGLLRRLEPIMEAAGVADEPIKLRVTGCPNGCARPYLGEIALVGKSLGRYNLYLGADFLGERLNALYAENLDEDAIVETLEPIIRHFGEARERGEHFGDFVARTGYVTPPQEGRDFNT